jgi:hypothetical protein
VRGSAFSEGKITDGWRRERNVRSYVGIDTIGGRSLGDGDLARVEDVSSPIFEGDRDGSSGSYRKERV